MLLSMTGHGVHDFIFQGQSFHLELKSVNHRFREISIHGPSVFDIEPKIRPQLEASILRGKIHCTLRTDGPSLRGQINLDLPQVERLLALGKTLSQSFGLVDDLSLSRVLSLPGVIVYSNETPLSEEFEQSLCSALQTLLEKFNLSRAREGAVLGQEIEGYLGKMLNEVNKIDGRRVSLKEEALVKLESRLAALNLSSLDPVRLHTEVALIVDKMEVEEEIVRLRSHIKSMQEAIQKGQDAGRRMNFLCQEAQREANTIGSKSAALEIIQSTIELKSLLEKVREQIQNLE